MPKKRKHKKSSGRRRVGALNKKDIMNTAMNIIAAGVGAVAEQLAAQKLDKTINPNTPIDVKPAITGGIAIVAGILLSTHKNRMIGSLGTGLAVGGAITLAKKFNIISGIGMGDAPIIMRRGISGRMDLPMITGANNGRAGYPETSRVNGFMTPEMNVISGNEGSQYMGGGYDAFSTY